MGKSIGQEDGKSGLQQTANAMWKKLGAEEMEAYIRRAEEANTNPAAVKKESRSKRVKRLSSLIRDSVSLATITLCGRLLDILFEVAFSFFSFFFLLSFFFLSFFLFFTKIDQLNDLGCPSLWVGLFDGVPERYFADGVGILARDEVFMNYTVSSLVKSVGRSHILKCTRFINRRRSQEKSVMVILILNTNYPSSNKHSPKIYLLQVNRPFATIDHVSNSPIATSLWRASFPDCP